MPAVHGSDDDFLYQLQAPVEPSPSNSANEFKERILNRIRNGCLRNHDGFVKRRPSVPSWQERFVRAFNSCWPF